MVALSASLRVKVEVVHHVFMSTVLTLALPLKHFFEVFFLFLFSLVVIHPRVVLLFTHALSLGIVFVFDVVSAVGLNVSAITVSLVQPTEVATL